MRMFPVLTDSRATTVLRFPDRALDARGLADHAGQLARGLAGTRRVAVWAERRIETCVGVVAGLLAGGAVVPVDPTSGERELQHIVRDSDPEIVLAAGARLPRQLAGGRMPTVDLDTHADAAATLPAEPDPETPALIVYTSGTTGPPKGAVLPRRAITSNLDALDDAWAWTAGDVVANALPLFHVHGLVLGILGPLRRGGCARYVGRFSPGAIAAALGQDATMLFGVPTMYRRHGGRGRARHEGRHGVRACTAARLWLGRPAARRVHPDRAVRPGCNHHWRCFQEAAALLARPFRVSLGRPVSSAGEGPVGG
jgi:malonyl-CoA/methylmalonyl-CoA synthetase